MATYLSFGGTLRSINDFPTGAGQPTGCYKMMTVQNRDGNVTNFIVGPDSYIVNHIMLVLGDEVVGFYDANTPVPMIYPPQYRAIVMSKTAPNYSVKVDYFNNQLVSSDGTLKLNVGPYTQIILENGQLFNGIPINRNLIVVYGITTMSIPAQTTPYQIIVMCQREV